MPRGTKLQQNQRRSIADMLKINQNINGLIQGEMDPLFGTDASGQEVARIHNLYHDIINSDKQTVMSSKPASLSTYGFLANSIAGGQYGYHRQSLTGDPKRDKWINRAKLEKAFTSGDTQMMAYFLSTNSDILHIYDEIDSICAYIYQLEEAIDVMRDCILSSDSPGSLVNYEVSFPGVSSDDSLKYKDIVKKAFQYNGINKKLSTIAIPKLLKYGTYYFMVVPYSEIGPKLNMMRRTVGSGAITMFESSIIDDELMPGITSLFEHMDNLNQEEPTTPYSKNPKNKSKLSKKSEDWLENIRHNIELIEVDESGEAIPNVFQDPVLENFDNLSDKVKSATEKVLKNLSKKNSGGYTGKTTKTNASDGVIDPSKFDDLQGCYVNVCDPRQLRPVKILDNVIGYYYLENYDYSQMGTSITDLLSNQINYNEQNVVIDNIVNAVLSKLTYGDVLKGDHQFRTMVLNCLLYAERRDSPIRIKFISPEYVIPFTVNQDEHGNGNPVLLRSLFYGRLYTSLLLFTITAIITKSTDTEFYWLKQSGLDQQYSNQVSDLIDQMRESNIDPLSIANGAMLHGNSNSAIIKRYYMNAGTSGERPFDMEVVGGQNIDIHNDLLTDLKKMTIGSTGVAAAMIDVLDEIEYASQLSMANIKNLKRCNTIQGDIDPSLTELIKTIIKFNFPNAIPENVLESMEIKLKRSKVIEGNLTAQQLSDAKGSAETMVDTYLSNSNTNPPEDDAFIKDNMVKELTMTLSTSAPWDLLPEIYERAIITAKKQQLEQQSRAGSSE